LHSTRAWVGQVV